MRRSLRSTAAILVVLGSSPLARGTHLRGGEWDFGLPDLEAILGEEGWRLDSVLEPLVATGREDEGDGPRKNGFYLGAFGAYNAFRGDLNDGDTVLLGFGDAILVPDLDDGFGFGLAIGARIDAVAFEISYEHTFHDARFQTFGGGDDEIGDASFNAVNLDLKVYPVEDDRLEPFLRLGVCFPWLVVEDALGEDLGGLFFLEDDAIFTGLGFNLGAGLSLYSRRSVAIQASAGYRFLYYLDVEGDEIDDELNGAGFNATLGLTLTF